LSPIKIFTSQVAVEKKKFTASTISLGAKNNFLGVDLRSKANGIFSFFTADGKKQTTTKRGMKSAEEVVKLLTLQS